MKHTEGRELLKAVLAVAVADGEIRRSEKGVVEGLAARLGVGKATLDRMFETAQRSGSIGGSILMRSKDQAAQALELLVATARIDGEISEEERSVIVRVATSLNLSSEDFQSIYQAGIARADKLRKSHGGS